MNQCKNELIERLLNQNMGLIVNQSRKMSNAVMTEEDARQEISLKIVEFVSTHEDYNELPFEQLGSVIRKVIMDFAIDKIRFYSRRPDTSHFHPDLEVIQLYKSSGRPTDESAIEEDLFSTIFNLLEKKEIKYPGITNFFSEALNPSDEVFDKFQEYKSTLKKRRNMADESHSFIPPLVLSKLLGFSPRKLLTYQLVIGNILSDLGFPWAENWYSKMTLPV